MTESWKDKLVGGFVTLAVTVVGAIILGWWSSPSDQKGVILVTDSDFTEQKRSIDGAQVGKVEVFARDYDFFNLKNDLSNFTIILPIKNTNDAPVIVKTQQSRAIIQSVSSLSEIQTMGIVKLKIQSIEKGGNISVRIESPSKFGSYNPDWPRADVKTIQILPPPALHIYL